MRSYVGKKMNDIKVKLIPRGTNFPKVSKIQKFLEHNLVKRGEISENLMKYHKLDYMKSS